MADAYHKKYEAPTTAFSVLTPPDVLGTLDFSLSPHLYLCTPKEKMTDTGLCNGDYNYHVLEYMEEKKYMTL
jgi:hypothetical protein